MDTYHWDVLVAYQWDVVGCFIWDLFETSWKRTDGLRPFGRSLRRSSKTLWGRTTKTSWRRSIETSLVVSFGTYLRCHWDVQRDVAATSSRRLNARWEVYKHHHLKQIFYHQNMIMIFCWFHMFQFHVFSFKFFSFCAWLFFY